MTGPGISLRWKVALSVSLLLVVVSSVIALALIAACGDAAATDTPQSPQRGDVAQPSVTPAPTDTPPPTDTPTPTVTATPEVTATATLTPTNTPGTGQILVPADEIPPADGYLLVDIEKCQGCLSCMLACSLIHEGVESPSLSRIQIMQNSFASFPDDLTIEQCRQCVDPACVKGCPTGALRADARYGNVRMVDTEKCIGCGLCFDACPYTLS